MFDGQYATAMKYAKALEDKIIINNAILMVVTGGRWGRGYDVSWVLYRTGATCMVCDDLCQQKQLCEHNVQWQW